jgi:hypothetical protein
VYTSGAVPALGPDGKYQVALNKVRFELDIAEDEVDLESGFIMLPQAIPQAAPITPPVPGGQPGQRPQPGPGPAPVTPGHGHWAIRDVGDAYASGRCSRAEGGRAELHG